MPPPPAVLVAALLLGPLAGCGVGAQDRGEPAPLPEALPTPPRPPGSGGGEDLVVYLVAGTSLAPVRRAVPERRPQDAVDQPLAGPTLAVVLALAGAGLSGCGDEDDIALAPNSPTQAPDVRGEDDLDDPYTGVLDPAFYEDLPAYAGQEITLLAEVAEVFSPRVFTLAAPGDAEVGDELVMATEDAGDVDPHAGRSLVVAATPVDSFEAGVVVDELGLDVDAAELEEWDERTFLAAEVLQPAP